MNIKHKLRPKADLAEVRELFSKGWNARALLLKIDPGAAITAAAIRAKLAIQYPPDDMAVCARYGFAKPQDGMTVNVRTPAGREWRERVGVIFSAPLVLPQHGVSLYAGGQLFRDADGERGLHPGVWEGFSEDQREACRKSWIDQAARHVPSEAEPWLVRYAEAMETCRRESDQVQAYVAERTHTWAELFERFPVIREALDA